MDIETLLTSYGGDTGLVILSVSLLSGFLRRKFPSFYAKYGDLLGFLGGFILFLIYGLLSSRDSLLSGSITAGACSQVVKSFLERASGKTGETESRLMTLTGILSGYLSYDKAQTLANTLLTAANKAADADKLRDIQQLLASNLTLNERQTVNLACVILAIIELGK